MQSCESVDVIQRLCNFRLIWFLRWPSPLRVFRWGSLRGVRLAYVRDVWEDELASVRRTQLRGRQRVIFHKYLVRLWLWVLWRLATKHMLLPQVLLKTRTTFFLRSSCTSEAGLLWFLHVMVLLMFEKNAWPCVKGLMNFPCWSLIESVKVRQR